MTKRPTTTFAPTAARTALAVCLLLAVSLRLVHLDWGLPHAYEEAQPLKQAWEMWGWGNRPFDLDPHFFHYPSLTFYTQMAGQAALYAGMRANRTVDSTAGFRARYYTDPTAFYRVGRLIGVLFALATVVLLWRWGVMAAGAWTGVLAAFLLAVNALHVSRSQMVEVDVPLTAFVTLALLVMTRLASAPSARRYALAGVAVGLATATKYTGALLVFPLVAAHVLARRTDADAATWRRLGAAVGAAALVFVATSPYVILDFSAFRHDLTLERRHMALGHFGLAHEPAWRYYLAGLTRTWVGVPAAVASVAGIVVAVIRRRAWAVVALAFLVPYLASIFSWTMMADRYALPLVPAVILFAATGVAALVDRLRGRRGEAMAVGIAAAALLSAPMVSPLRAGIAERGRVDSRTRCLEWIRTHVPPSSLIVTEAYGPPLFGPLEFWGVEGDIRGRVYDALAGDGFYGVLPIALFQSSPEDTAPYYDIDLYRFADVLITTSAVRGRYTADPQRFPHQVAFYDSLDADFPVLATFESSGAGPSLTLYALHAHTAPFGQRVVGGPVRLRNGAALPPAWRATFYYRVGLNYEAFGHLDDAVAAYQLALPGAANDSELFKNVAFGMVRTLSMQKRWSDAESFVAQMMARAPGEAERAFIGKLTANLRAMERHNQR